ncbi:hypothetical protein [Dactylosporangium sp. NPDC000521]|uniref:hypothetical protein n=1 Tax=Dactylosporangium sp. NPDC000521 TaxID=3363975 RepID=UPI003696CBEC
MTASVGSAVVTASPAYADTISDFTLSESPFYGAANDIPLVKATMTAVFQDGNHAVVPNGSACSGAKKSSNPGGWYCFASSDTSSNRLGPDIDPEAWIPQAMTGVSDALDDEDWNGNSGMLIGWYHEGSSGARVSLLNLNQSSAYYQKYRHILLANPYYDGTRATFKALTNLHIGGMVWYGDYLYVVDTNWGIRVFSTKYIFDLGASTNGTTSCSGIGYVDTNNNGVADSYCASTYKYVMTQIGFWQRPSASSSSAFCNGGSGNPRFSYISLDRAATPDRLIVGEWCKSTDTSKGRVVAYNMNNGSTVTHKPNDGRPDAAWNLPESNIQGAAIAGGHMYLNQSNGYDNGKLYKTTIGSGTLTVSGSPQNTPVGPEDLSLLRSDNSLWSVTEHLTSSSGTPGRMIYKMPVA